MKNKQLQSTYDGSSWHNSDTNKLNMIVSYNHSHQFITLPINDLGLHLTDQSKADMTTDLHNCQNLLLIKQNKYEAR
jgi:hypothetical protein